MPKIQFSGRVFPFVYDITMRGHPNMSWDDEELGLKMTFAISLSEGKVTIDCDVNKFDQNEHLSAIYVRAYDVVRTYTDLIAFSTGFGITVLIENFTPPDGVEGPFVIQDLRLAQFCTAYSSVTAKSIEENELEKVIRVVIVDWRISHAMRELIEAIAMPHQSTMACARAIEGLRSILAPGTDRKMTWPVFREALNLSQEYLQLITDTSRGPRHAEHTRIPGTTTTEIVKRTWIIMDRFLHLKKRGLSQLPLSEFPLLSEPSVNH